MYFYLSFCLDNIECQVNYDVNSTDPFFLAKKVVKSQNIFLLSSFLDNIECRVDYDGNQRGLCNQMMYVGYSALPPDNFTCISGNIHDIYSRIQDFRNLQETNFSF